MGGEQKAITRFVGFTLEGSGRLARPLSCGPGLAGRSGRPGGTLFGDVGWGEVAVLVVLALFIFGPERLPKLAADLGKGLRQVRRMAQSARRDLEQNLGPEMGDLDIADLNPRRFVRKHLFEDGFDDVDDVVARPSGRGRRTAVSPDDGERPPYDTDAT